MVEEQGSGGADPGLVTDVQDVLNKPIKDLLHPLVQDTEADVMMVIGDHEAVGQFRRTGIEGENHGVVQSLGIDDVAETDPPTVKEEEGEVDHGHEIDIENKYFYSPFKPMTTGSKELIKSSALAYKMLLGPAMANLSPMKKLSESGMVTLYS